MFWPEIHRACGLSEYGFNEDHAIARKPKNQIRLMTLPTIVFLADRR